MTKLYNRNKFNELLKYQLRFANRYKVPISLILFDIDFFKKINDNFGHDIGDSVLKKLATLLKKECRESDILARWGGEEFICLLPSSDHSGCREFAEKLRKIIEEKKFRGTPQITVSIGATTYRENESFDSMFKRCDKALYEAKQSGRNRVCYG